MALRLCDTHAFGETADAESTPPGDQMKQSCLLRTGDYPGLGFGAVKPEFHIFARPTSQQLGHCPTWRLYGQVDRRTCKFPITNPRSGGKSGSR